MYSLLDPLDCQCSHEHIYKIASLDYNLKAVAKRLIGPQQAHDIIDQEELSEQDKRDEVFEQWLKVKGSKATYKELVALFETLKCTEAAKAVRMLVTSNAQSDGNEKCNTQYRYYRMLHIWHRFTLTTTAPFSPFL